MSSRARACRPLVAALALAQLSACAGPVFARVPERPPPTADVAIGRKQDPQQMLARLSQRLLDDFFARAPVSATSLGEHRYDDQWPDLSPASLRGDDTWSNEMLVDSRAIPRAALSPSARVELDTLVNRLELWRFSARVEQAWRCDPLAYTGLISSGLDELISRDYAPVEQRATSLAARLERLPALIEQAIANLDDAQRVRRPQLEVALAQLPGLRALIEQDIPTHTAEVSAPLRARIAAASPPALAALDTLQLHLESIAPEAHGRWRLGSEAFARKLSLTLGSERSADELVALARAEHERVRRDMHALARELYAAMYGERELARFERNEPDAGARPDALVAAVLDALGAAHPAPAQLREAAQSTLAELQDFVSTHALVPMDPSKTLEVIWTPAHARGVAIAGLAPPPPLDAGAADLPSFYLVQPIPAHWDAPLVESYLREYNHFMLEILSIHEAIPGHFVQLYWAEREPSRVRRVFQNGAFVEGWAVYAEQLMVEAGYAGVAPEAGATRPPELSEAVWSVLRDDELRAQAIALHGLKFYLRTVTNAILDHEIHAGSMTREQAITLMVEHSFQARAEAEGKWTRAQISSTQLSTYFVGASEWASLRERAEAEAAAAGKPFDVLEFHREALSHGAPPVARLPELMGWARPRAASPLRPDAGV